jgi:hypothetical protein
MKDRDWYHAYTVAFWGLSIALGVAVGLILRLLIGGS